ncbi:MAG: hypothetical protein ABWZ17_05455, partial [Candidatus Binatia bacterium]
RRKCFWGERGYTLFASVCLQLSPIHGLPYHGLVLNAMTKEARIDDEKDLPPDLKDSVGAEKRKESVMRERRNFSAAFKRRTTTYFIHEYALGQTVCRF